MFLLLNQGGEPLQEQFQLVSEFNSHTFLVSSGDKLFVLKYILPVDLPTCELLACLDSPNLAKVYGTTQFNGKLCVVQEFVDGFTIEQYINNHGIFTESQVKSIALQICEGLKALHSKKIVHRDITPSNIMLTPELQVKVIDYDISRVSTKQKSTDTQVLGTQGFAAPEQFGFEQTSERSDIYSLGVLINYMLTGEIPSRKLATGFLGDIVIDCTHIDPKNRFSSVNALANRIGFKSSFKYRLKSAFPGFRGNSKLLKFVSGLYYLSAISLIVLALAFVNESHKYYAVAIFSLVTLAPVLAGGNAFYWVDSFPLTKHASASTKALARVIAGVICFAITFAVMLCVP